jgi:hypothetical protein
MRSGPTESARPAWLNWHLEYQSGLMIPAARRYPADRDAAPHCSFVKGHKPGRRARRRVGMRYGPCILFIAEGELTTSPDLTMEQR